MNTIDGAFRIDTKYAETGPRDSLPEFERSRIEPDDFSSLLIDIHHENDVKFHYLRLKTAKEHLTVSFPEYQPVSQASHDVRFGLVLRAAEKDNMITIWLPSNTHEVRVDAHRRIFAFKHKSFILKWEIFPALRLVADGIGAVGDDRSVCIPYIVFNDPSGEIFKAFSDANIIESRLFRKSNWFSAGSPSDIWNYLINGSVYDPRMDRSIKKRFICQQCAFSWWNYFELLKRITGKKIYSILQDEVAFSVLKDLSPDGEWGHGFWSDNIETHARFHLDGIHLLISQYEKTKGPAWLEAARRAMEFIFENLTDSLDEDQIWFLHDTIEPEHRHRFNSTLFGKSPGNSLCINTHVQALTVLNRLRPLLPDNPQYGLAYNKGCNALKRVLAYKPADVLYKLFAFWFVNDKAPNARKSMLGRIMHKIVNQLLNRVFWPLQKRFPRLVHPNGFIERDLSLSMASGRYMVTNVKDLLTLYRQDPLPWLKPYIQQGTAFLRKFNDAAGLSRSLQKSPYFIEFIDILMMAGKLIEAVPAGELKTAEETIFGVTGGYSIDSFASPLVRQPHEISGPLDRVK